MVQGSSSRWERVCDGGEASGSCAGGYVGGELQLEGTGEEVNFRDKLLDKIGTETVEAIVVGDWGQSYETTNWEDNDWLDHPIPNEIRGVPCQWSDVHQLLNYEWDDGFGGMSCHALWIWTPTRIIFISEYDGATNIESLPRNPQPGHPWGI